MSEEPAAEDESASDATGASDAGSSDAGDDERPPVEDASVASDDSDSSEADDSESDAERGSEAAHSGDARRGPAHGPTEGNPGRTTPPGASGGDADGDFGTDDDSTSDSTSDSSSDPSVEDADEAGRTEPVPTKPERPRTDSAGEHAPVGAQAPQPDRRSTSVAAGEPAAAGAGGGGGGGGGILSGGIGGSAPPDDEELPLTEHIEEMLMRLTVVVVVAAVATVLAFPLANDIIVEMWYDVHTGTVESCKTAPQTDGCVPPHVYGPLELVLTRIRVAGLAGLLVALPLAVYQTYRFMRPGLYPHERRYYLAAVPFSLVLAVIGMVFAYFVLLPLLFAYFIGYTQGTADLAFQLAETMNLILVMMGMLAVIFQIPLLIMLAIMMGLTTRRWLERRRLYFWGLFLGVAVLFGPDPTGMAPMLLTATMVVLFEGTLLLLRWTGR